MRRRREIRGVSAFRNFSSSRRTDFGRERRANSPALAYYRLTRTMMYSRVATVKLCRAAAAKVTPLKASTCNAAIVNFPRTRKTARFLRFATLVAILLNFSAISPMRRGTYLGSRFASLFPRKLRTTSKRAASPALPPSPAACDSRMRIFRLAKRPRESRTIVGASR